MNNATAIELDMTNPGQPCVDCGTTKPTDERGRCRLCAEEISISDEPAPMLAAPPTVAANATAADFTAIASEAAANATTQGIGSQRGPNATMRGAGFNSAAGYIQAIHNGVPAHTHQHYIAILRSQYGMTSADVAALALPGPMAQTSLPVGAGVLHAPAGHVEGSAGIFERPRAQRQFIVGPSAEEQEQAPRVDLTPGNIVAGAAAQGNGVIVGWRGLGTLTRGALREALGSIGRVDLLPNAMSARAQAGKVITDYNSRGMVARPARKGVKSTATWAAKWTIGAVNHENSAGQSYGDIVLTIELTTDGVLKFDGDEKIAASIQLAYQALVDAEVYQAGDVTSWLSSRLHHEFKAVSFGVGYYIPQRHAAAAESLCRAISGAGWGHGWVIPALPVADSNQLRDGIVRGLKEEVSDVMTRLAVERETAKTERQSGDIGERRAASFLKELREVGARVVAYGQVLGEERVSEVREVVRTAVVSLETLLGSDYLGISARFSLIWEEIERDQRMSGGAL